MYENILFEKKDGVAYLTLNRPDRLNALNSAVLKELDEALAEIDGDAEIRVLVVKGAGEKALAAGDRDAALPRIIGTLDMQDAAKADVVIEAAVEKLDVKRSLFSKLSGIVSPECILATNTSSLSITAVASAVGRPDKVVGLHFFNPVPRMALIEIIRGAATSDETYEAAKALSERLGKTAVTVNEYPGFVVNRILIPMINEAVFMLQEGVASAEDIDTAMKLGANHPMGPLALADLIGLDVCLAIMELLRDEMGEGKYRPAPLLRKLVRAGRLGRKSGEGFFRY